MGKKKKENTFKGSSSIPRVNITVHTDNIVDFKIKNMELTQGTNRFLTVMDEVFQIDRDKLRNGRKDKRKQ